MNNQSFIDEHMKVCTTKPVKKYDPKKPVNAMHSLEYSKRKCAKKLWKARVRKLNNGVQS